MKKTKKRENKRVVYFGLGGLILILITTVLMVGLRNNLGELTGSSVSIKYYGVSNYLMGSQAGKMQTYIYLKQPTLKELGKNVVGDAKALEVAKEIAEAADFAQGIVESYQNNPAAPLVEGALDAVRVAAEEETNNFQSEKVCLKKIGENHGSWGEIELALISELVYIECSTAKPGQLFGYVKHTFFEEGSGQFICSQGGNKLFLIERKTGMIATNTTGC